METREQGTTFLGKLLARQIPERALSGVGLAKGLNEAELRFSLLAQ